MPAEEGQPDDQPRVTGQVPPPAPTTGLEQILPGRPPLPHAEEKGAFFVYQRELAPGTRLEQYEIIRVLGSGGFGITYLAKDLFLNRNVVIKENFPSRYSYRDPLTGHIRPNNEHDLENYTWALKSFLSEAQTLAELNNPGIVRILSVFEANGTAYFAMEHITGLSLDYLGEKLHSTGHRYTEDELKGLLTRLLRILDYLHSRHIYHRDIKPGNILLTEEGTPVLIDFGAARHALKLHAATVLTTQGYSSPEQALGKTNIGPWSDLYSVGATFYALLTGNPPDRAEARLAEDEMQPLHSDPVLTRYYSRQFLLSLDKALAPQINCRYQTAGEWIHDICAISGEESSATIQVLPADLRHAHPEGMPTPGAGKNIGSRKAATGTDGLHSASRRQSARALRRNRHMMSLLVGSACTILLGAGAFYLLDYMKKAPMGTTINTIKEAIQQPAASSSVGEPEPPPRDLASIRIPELKITEDAALEPRSLTEFRLRLDDTILTRSGLPPILPEKLRISCIYLQIIPPAANGEKLYLTIRDSNGVLVDRSINAVPSFTVPGQSTSTFFFPALPELSTNRTYTYSFENAAHQAVPMQMACFKNEKKRTEEAFPKIRFIAAPPVPEPALLHDPAYKNLVAAIATPSPENKNILDQTSSMPGMLPALEQLSKAGYPIAQQALGKTLMSPDCPGGSRPEEGVEWLYRSATGGCYEAMKELGILLMDIPSYFPRLPQQPPLASRDYAQAARFLRMAVQYRDQEALYLLSLMYSQGWGVPASPELSSLMMERLNGSSYSTDSLNPNAPIAAYWLPLPLAGEKNTILRFTIPGPFAPSQLKGVTLHNTSLKDAFSISKINILQHGRLILDIISPQEVLPGKSSAPIGISIPEGLLADTTLPLEVEILLTPGNSCGVVEMPPPVEKKNSRIEIN